MLLIFILHNINFPFAYLIGIDLHIVFMHVRCILENLVLLDSCEKPIFLFWRMSPAYGFSRFVGSVNFSQGIETRKHLMHILIYDMPDCLTHCLELLRYYLRWEFYLKRLKQCRTRPFKYYTFEQLHYNPHIPCKVYSKPFMRWNKSVKKSIIFAHKIHILPRFN